MADTLLEVRDLEVHFNTYEGRAEVLHGVDLTVEEGETVALVGESGCGKSVTAETMVGMLPQPPAEIVGGELYYRDEELLGDAAAHKRVKSESMGMIFQDPMTSLSPVYTVGEMMRDVLTYKGQTDVGWLDIARSVIGRRGADGEAMRERCIELLDSMQIPDPEGVLDRYPVELSGGMRQRVLISMALLSEPEFLVADEPTTALDVTTQDQILDLLAEQVDDHGLSMLYITHNLGVARRIADRIYVMYAGDIVEVGSRDDVLDEPLHPYSRGLIDSVPKLTAFDREGIEGVIPDYIDPPSGCRFHPRCPAAMEGECDVEKPPRFQAADREVACHLYEDGLSREAAVDIATSEITFEETNGSDPTPPGETDSTSQDEADSVVEPAVSNELTEEHDE